MANLVRTKVYLEQSQKKAIAAKAKARGTNLSMEVRRAVGTYLADATQEELFLLDAATREAKVEIDQMIEILDAGQARARRFFTEIEKIKRGARER